MKKKLIILSIIGIVLIGIIAGASFAYFSTANNIGSENVVTSGTMSLLFTDGQEVSANNLIPGEYIEKTFKVKNTGNVDTRYDVYFSEVINTFVDKTDLVYTLTSNDGGYNTVSEVQVPDTEAKIVNQQLITPNAEHTYTLRITFKLKQTNQNTNMGRTFTAKININEYNSNTQEKLLKLIDASGNEVDKQIVGASQTNYTLALSNTDLTSSTNIYCNNGGIPTISGNTLNVSGITNDTICTISNDIVDTINNKLSTTKTGIVMTNDQSDTTRMIINNNKEVVLDLNGKEIVQVGISDDSKGTYVEAYEVVRLFNSKLTVNDSIGTGGMYTGTTSRVFYPLNGSELVINNGNYNGRQTLVISGTDVDVTINGGNLNANTYQVIGANECNSDCDLTINGGTFNSVNWGILNTVSNITINDGEFVTKSSTIENQSNGTIIINDGKFVSEERVINGTNGTININGGNYESTGSNTIYVSGGIVNINGNAVIKDSNNNYESGTYIHSGYKAQLVYLNGGTINVNGGTLEATYADAVGCCAIYNSNATVKIEGGDIYSYRDFALYSSGANAKYIINGGTMRSNRFASICHDNGNVYINDGNIISETTVAITNYTGNLYINGGNITGSNYALSSPGYSDRTGSKTYICGGTFKGNSGNHINITDTTASIDYKSGATWYGGSTPSIVGAGAANVVLNNSITCPAS